MQGLRDVGLMRAQVAGGGLDHGDEGLQFLGPLLLLEIGVLHAQTDHLDHQGVLFLYLRLQSQVVSLFLSLSQDVEEEVDCQPSLERAPRSLFLLFGLGQDALEEETRQGEPELEVQVDLSVEELDLDLIGSPLLQELLEDVFVVALDEFSEFIVLAGSAHF